MEDPIRHRAVAAVLHAEGRVLLCHRRADRSWYPDVWDLPGGHVEDGETAPSALARELAEELGVRIPPPDGAPLVDGVFGGDTHMMIWAIDGWRGQPVNRAVDEHDRIGWFEAAELANLELADPAIATICAEVIGADRIEGP